MSAVELKLKPGADVTAVQRKIARILGDEFVVLDRYEQHAVCSGIMEIEKFISYLFLTYSCDSLASMCWFSFLLIPR